MSWLVERLAGALRPGERDAVLGDLEESGTRGLSAAWQVAGLLARRQSEEWRHWGPWLALVGVVGVAGISISGLAASLIRDASLQSRTWWKYGVRYGTGLTWQEDVAVFACFAVAVILWSWTAGFALRRLSGMTAWLTGGLLLIETLVMGGLGLAVPVWFGMRRAGAPGWPRLFPIACLAAVGFVWWAQVLKSQAISRWVGSGWQARGPNIWDLLGVAMACWPAIYVLVMRRRQTQ